MMNLLINNMDENIVYHCDDCKYWNITTAEAIADSHCPICGVYNACGCVCFDCFVVEEEAREQ